MAGILHQLTAIIMPTTEQRIEQRARAIQREIESKFRINRAISGPYALIAAAIEVLTGRPAPRIISGFRTQQRQRDLFVRWSRGDPGVPFRPAKRSWHTLGRAIDTDRSNPTWNLFQRVWGQWMAGVGRDGATFGDAGHFDVPGPTLPPVAF